MPCILSRHEILVFIALATPLNTHAVSPELQLRTYPEYKSGPSLRPNVIRVAPDKIAEHSR